MTPIAAPTIRLACAADLPAIREIYNHYVRTSTCTFQIEEDTATERSAWFAAHGPKHPVVIAELANEFVGWGSLSPWKERTGYAHTVEASVYVRADQVRRGIGRAILSDLIERARQLGHHIIIGGACTEQPGSIALQEALGFHHVGTFKEVGYKFYRWLDVVYLQFGLR